MWRRLPLSLLPWMLIFALVPAPTSADEPRNLLETEHLRVSGRVPEAWLETAGELAEALYPALEKHWGRAPAPQRLPLELTLHPDRASFQRAVRAEGVTMDLSLAGGYTTERTIRSHVFLQGVAFETRRLILHELTHQFDDRSAMRQRGRVPPWYREGIAEYFGWHRRGPKGIEFGQFDVIARNHRPSQIVPRLMFEPFLDGWKIATGEQEADYTSSLAVVAGLLQTKNEGVRDLFREWERKHVHRAGMQGAFTKLCAKRAAEIKQAVDERWRDFAYPWRLPKPGFDVFGDTIVADSQAFRRLEANDPSALWELRAAVTVEDGSRAGLFMRDADGMYVLLEVDHSEVTLYESGSLSGKALVTRHRWRHGSPRGTPVMIRLAASATGVAGIVKGTGRSRGIEPSAHPAHMGLFVRYGKATFHTVERVKLPERMKLAPPR